MRRRIFVAIPIPDPVKEKVMARERGHHTLRVRWIKPENLHITVVPPWYASEEELREVLGAIREGVQRLEPFPVRFTKLLFGPPGGTPRLIWAEGETPSEFISLKEKLEELLFANPRTGFMKKEKRPAKLHLTVARFRPGSLAALPPLDGGISWDFEVTEIILMESELKRGGAEYIPLSHFALA